MIINNENTAHEREQDFPGESASVSSNESSQTHTKSDRKYETLTGTSVMGHSYESILATC